MKPIPPPAASRCGPAGTSWRTQLKRPLMVVLYLLLALVAILAVAELASRASGLGRPLLFERTAYGYRIQPGQDFRFLGRPSVYNDLGLRSGPVAPLPSPGTLRVLCIGDSITNGGVVTAQDDTYPYQLAKLLAGQVGEVEVLNISAGGWALENEEGWIAEHGILGSQLVILQVATHDMHQRMAGASVLDTHLAFPSRPPVFATGYVWRRYVLRKLGLRPKLNDPGVVVQPSSAADIHRSVAVLERIAAHVRRAGARLLVVHVAQPGPLEPVDDLTALAKSRLRDWAALSGVTLVSLEDTMNASGGVALFRDSIHPNEQGNRVIAQTVAAHVVPEISDRKVAAHGR